MGSNAKLRGCGLGAPPQGGLRFYVFCNLLARCREHDGGGHRESSMAPKKAPLVADDIELRFSRRIELKYLRHKKGGMRLCFEAFARDGKWKVWLFSSDPAQRVHEIVSAVQDLRVEDIPDSFKGKLLAGERFVLYFKCPCLLPWHVGCPC